jgi:opacity protein-like surface antigen
MIRSWKAAVFAALLSTLPQLSQAAIAQDSEWSKTGTSHSFGVFAGQTIVTLGSNDIRRGYGGYFSYGKPEPQFKLWSIPAQLVYEFGVDTTHSSGYQEGANDHAAVWAFPYARYRFRTRHRMGAYLDAGVGLYYTHTSADISSVISTSPTVDFGVAFRQGAKDELLVGLRLRHVSDAGLRGPNAGQNGLFLVVEYRY